MNPEDQLRSLRDNSRWTFGELQPRALSRPPVRRRAWLSLPAVIAEIAVITVVASAVVGVIAFQNREVPPVAVGPTPSASPEAEPDDFLRGRATCTSLLDDETVARLKGLGMTPSEGTAALPGEQLTPFLERGIVCRWRGEGVPSVTFAYSPVFGHLVANYKKHLIEEGAQKVEGSFSRVTDPQNSTGGYGFAERFWVYADGGSTEDIVPEVFARASVTAIGTAETGRESEPSATWKGPGSSLTVGYLGGCGAEVGDVDLVAPGQITVHIVYPPGPLTCTLQLLLDPRTTSTVPLPEGVGPDGATVTVINDYYRYYTSAELE